jgi:hypothetical protein
MNAFLRSWSLRFLAALNDPKLLAGSRLVAFPRSLTRQRKRKLNFRSTFLTMLDVRRESTSLKLHRLCGHTKGSGVDMEVS